MLHYEILGNGKIPLVLLHGFMEDSRIWKDLEVFLSKNFKIIKIDLPGHGESRILENTNLETFAEKVMKTLQNLNIEKFHILGHSMGGYVGLALCEFYSEFIESLTLFFSHSLEDFYEKTKIRERSLNIIEKYYTMFVNNSIQNLFNPYELEKLNDKIILTKNIALSQNPKGIIHAQKAMIKRKNRNFVLENFPNKILIILGNRDTAIDNELFLKQIPNRKNIKIYTIESGHNGHLEKPEICGSIINFELLSPC